MSKHSTFNFSLLGICVASLFSTSVSAQGADAAANQPVREEIDEVIVTGFRASLESSANAKRESVNFTDSVFAEDIGKFSDLNIAESLSRVPGVLVNREVNGEGLSISIRGLGTSFTKNVLNGTQIAVASSGRTDGQNSNREVDLDLFPTELFTRFDVSKTPTASMLEGGVSGLVNMRSARPFDSPGTHFTYQLQSNYGEISEDFSPRVGFTGSWTNDTFGILIGGAAQQVKYKTVGWEANQYTNLNVGNTLCGTAPTGTQTGISTAAACNISGGNQYNIPGRITTGPAAGQNGNGVVPMGAGAGLVAGTVIDRAFLEANNPGTSLEQLSEGLIPRLGRPADFDGTRDRYSGLVSLEWRPTDSMRFFADTLYSQGERKFDRLDMNWVVRNSTWMIPLDVVVDDQNVITSGTFANSQFFLEARRYDEYVDFWNFNPGAHFDFGDKVRLDFQVNKSRSWFLRESPTILVNSPVGNGTVVEYTNEGGDFPDVQTNIDLNDPNLGWTWAGGRLNIQNEKRVTHTEGAHLDLTFGEEDSSSIKVGLAYDKIDRGISPRDNSGAWEDLVCRGFDAMGVRRGSCDGDPLGQSSQPLAVPQSALASYLTTGPGFIGVDFDRFFADTNYRALSDAAPIVNSSSTNTGRSDISEETTGAYVEFNHSTEVASRPMRMNVGGRYVQTDQEITGPNVINGVTILTTLPTTYHEFLPSFNVAYNVTDSIIARLSASKTMTRVNPAAIVPATVFGDPAARSATQGNPTLAPFVSDNFDIGAEWYTGDEGYVALTLFQKKINAFTVTAIETIPFAELGIPFENLSPTQQLAITNGGGPDNWTVNVSRQVNAPGRLKVEGYEVIWSQPLTFVTEGLGFTMNYTRIVQDTSGAPTPGAARGQFAGVAPHTFNGTVYFERGSASVRASYTWNERRLAATGPQQGVTIPGSVFPTEIWGDESKQLDLSASYEFANLPTSPELTLNVTNITGEGQRSVITFDNAGNTWYEPGYTVILGLRGKF